ncbi:hypothetical protein FRB95_002552 [Tulasnella sp. JGI-2019a]|nr:hypothetical protein FRB95_002552 [Tulasnella sp. JGI-2019a]
MPFSISKFLSPKSPSSGTPITRTPSRSPTPSTPVNDEPLALSLPPTPLLSPPPVAGPAAPHRKTQIFGTELQKSIAIAHTRLDSKDSRGEHREWGLLPLVLAKTGLKVKEYVSQTPNKATGIFQHPVDPEQLLKLQATFEAPPRFGSKVKWHHFSSEEAPHLAAELFIKFLRSLPTPLLPEDRLPEFVDAYQCAEQAGSRATHLRYVELLRSLPFSNMYVLLYVFDVLDYVSRQGNVDRRLLASIFTPILFKPRVDGIINPALIDTLEYLTLQRDFDWTILGLSQETAPLNPVDPTPEPTPSFVTPVIVPSDPPSTPRLSSNQEVQVPPPAIQSQDTTRDEFARAGMSAPAPPKHESQKLLLSPSETTHIPDISKQIRRTSEEMADRGGFYAVYRGQHDTEGEVALRLPLPKYEIEALERRFWREAEIWFDLHHKHISRLLGTFHDNFGHYMVSPWLTHGNVMSCIRNNTPFDQVKVLCGIADALVYLHGKGYVHGDLKMENVLLSDGGDALLTDFGLTRHLETVVTSSTVMNTAGNFRWFAPEIAQGSPKSMEGDVYAFGMMISEALTRQIPFSEFHTVYQLMKALMDNKRPSKEDILYKQAPACAEELWKLAEECWDVDSACRPTMVTAFERINQM